VLRACVDASWSDQPPRVTVVAGYVAPLDESARVEDEWIAGLRDWRIPYFRLSQLRALVGRDADLCERFFSNIITSSKLAGVGAAVLNADWDEPDWGDDATIRLPTRYEQCLDSMLALIGKYAMKNFPGNSVAVLCCADSTSSVIEGAFKRRQLNYPHLATITIKSSRNEPFMQCADLGAGRLRRSWRAIAKGAPEADHLPWGAMPGGKGVKGKTSFWSLRQGAVLARALRIHEKRPSGK
jgi:hypothetical protein